MKVIFEIRLHHGFLSIFERIDGLPPVGVWG
jgi:hypothetical protein